MAATENVFIRCLLMCGVLVTFACTNGLRAVPEPDGDGGGSLGAPGVDAPVTGSPVNAQNDAKNCGAPGHNCAALPNVRAAAAVECRAGTCWVPPAGCIDGFAHCTARADDGCETSISRPESCGSCTKTCDAAAPFCANAGNAQTCVASCAAATPDVCGSRCVDLQTDVANCGVCGNACAFPNADAACLRGTCAIARCKVGYGDCSPDPGCETPLLTANNCGVCGKSCVVDRGVGACLANGTCGPVVCEPGFGNCDSSSPDCETPLTTDTHCGGCTTACSGATPFCSSSGGRQTCVSDCPASASMKCGSKCVDVNTDKANCGQCGIVCEFANADGACVNGQCTMGACKSGFGDCTNEPGCETRLDSTAHCGRCGNACAFANATSSCDGTKCTTPVCQTGYGNCDTTSLDCETALTTPGRCGDCETSCGGQTPLCSSSTGKPACVSDCAASTPTKCGTKCVNTLTDAENCGTCSKTCAAPNANATCANGTCATTCRTGFADCNAQAGCETNTQTDAGNCGACGRVCPASARCTNGQCCDTKMGQNCPASECQTGTYNCAGDCVLKNKEEGTRCGTSNCPAKICKNGVCDFGGINSCPAGQVCTRNHGCILSGRRSKTTLPNNSPYEASCQPCGAPFGFCCEGRSCPGGRQCIQTFGEYCVNCAEPGIDCSATGDNSYCERNYY